MNLSGFAVAEFVNYRNLATEDLLVVVDDVDLPLGRMRARARGSAGTPPKGHVWSARTRASCTASSAKSSRAAPSQRASRDTIWPALWRKRCSTSASTSEGAAGS